MKTRLWWLAFGMAFAVTLAVVVGQRMSAEAMAVMMGVVAGVAASIPTSLIVAWFALRASHANRVVEVTSARASGSVAAEPRIVVLAQPPQSAPAYQHYAGYGPNNYAQASGPESARHYNPHAGPQSLPAPRNFTVVGGEDFSGEDYSYETLDVAHQASQEVIWQR